MQHECQPSAEARPASSLKDSCAWYAFCLLLATAICIAPRGALADDSASHVLRFEVPLQRIEDGRRRNFIENCSAFVAGETADAAILLSSWHCLDGNLRLRQLPNVTVNENAIAVEILAAGGSMAEDWLMLSAPRDILNHVVITPLNRKPVVEGEALIGIGWGNTARSGTKALRQLPCNVISVTATIALECGFKKGDSGGLIARETSGGTLEAVGIISAGDSTSITHAYPVSALPRLPN